MAEKVKLTGSQRKLVRIVTNANQFSALVIAIKWLYELAGEDKEKQEQAMYTLTTLIPTDEGREKIKKALAEVGEYSKLSDEEKQKVTAKAFGIKVKKDKKDGKESA